ncbi:MAG: flavin reductase family protein [Geminicoccaceae bacterium]
MYFDFDTTTPRDRYKLLTSLVVPRPIALVTTLDKSGQVNAAPYSFFNVFSQAPAICVIGIERKNEHELKDTAAHIERTGEFVVNLVDEAIASSMNICAIDFPVGQGELEPAGFTAAPSTRIDTPRIAEAPAALECRNHSTLMLGPARRLVIGEIIALHVRDSLVDSERLYIDHQSYKPVGRLSGSNYCTTTDTFALDRQTFADWLASQSTAAD